MKVKLWLLTLRCPGAGVIPAAALWAAALLRFVSPHLEARLQPCAWCTWAVTSLPAFSCRVVHREVPWKPFALWCACMFQPFCAFGGHGAWGIISLGPYLQRGNLCHALTETDVKQTKPFAEETTA